MATPAITDWRSHLIEDDEGIARVLHATRRVAVLGIKIETWQPAHYVAAYCQRAGLTVVPVPVYYPDATEILGERVYRHLADIPGEVDMVDVFRRPRDIPPHLDDIIDSSSRPVAGSASAMRGSACITAKLVSAAFCATRFASSIPFARPSPGPTT